MQYGGWTGKVLRVDLTTGAITTEDTTKYKEYLGGTGLGYKVLWDEVPAGTRAWDPENRIVFGVGPLTGTGAPCTGRVSITTLWPAHVDELPGSGHMGGHWGPELKYAGWDSIIVQGASATPVWIKIVDDKVTIEDASRMWGNGIYRATEEICSIMGSGAHVAAIGQAGENLARLSCVICDRSHSAGGAGSVMGSKNLKAIGVLGSGSLKISADKKAWADFNKRYLSMMGANNQMVVPRTKQPWAEYNSSGSRWTADKGIYWGAASPPVETGYCSDVEHPSVDCPSPLNKIGLRTHKGYGDFGIPGMNHTVKMNGCHACPIRCHIATDIPALEQYGVSRYNQNTCIGNSIASGLMSTNAANPDSAITNAYMSNSLCDDYGFWSDYSQYSNDYKWMYTHVMTQKEIDALGLPALNVNGLPTLGRTPFQNRLPAAELKVLSGNDGGNKPYTAGTPWARADAGDPSALQFLVPLICANGRLIPGTSTPAPVLNGLATPTFAKAICMGPAFLAKEWPEIGYFNNHWKSASSAKMNHAKHHGVESFGQIGVLNGMLWNRDAQNHTHQNIVGCGLPLTLINTIMKEMFTQGKSIFNDPSGSDITFTSAETGYKPVTPGMAAMTAATVVYLELHNSLTVCNYTLPVWVSPLKSLGYRGAAELESQTYSLVTGDTLDQKGLETVGLRIFTLFRALTARYMDYYVKQADPSKSVNMRVDHDQVNDWHFDKVGSTTTGPVTGPGTGIPNSVSGNTDGYPATDAAFTGTSQLMTRADIDQARSLLYAQFGWDSTGMPTAATLNALGLGYVQAGIPQLITS
jgi:aldehyde:ferredoxin oxidoreductase